MDALLERLSCKLLQAGKHKAYHTEYSLLQSDSERVKYTIQLLIDYSRPLPSKIISKSSEESSRLREMGNFVFSMKIVDSYLDVSIQKYTESIVFAPTGSEELSIAYGNRSAMLILARLYDDCLLDISRALALPYPDNLKAKLYARQARCLMARGISSKSSKQELEKCRENGRLWLDKMDPKNTTKSEVEKILKGTKRFPAQAPYVKWDATKNLPKLIDENKQIPGLSASLELKYSDEFGKHMVATRDIDPGDVLGIMEPYACVLVPEKMLTHCWGCLEQTWSSIPCPNCVNVIYCSEECRDKAWEEHHDVECPVIGVLLHQEMSNLGLLSLRIAIKAIKQAGGIEELRKKVEKIEGRTGIPDGFNGKIFDDKDYANVYTLARNTDKRSVPDLVGRSLNSAFIVYTLATRTRLFGKQLPADLEELKENEDVIFVGGLIMRHQQIIPSNVHGVSEEGLGTDPVEKSAALMPVYSLINHSCCPSVCRVNHGRKMVLYSETVISKGEQVFDNYGLHYAMMPKSYRRFKLLQQFLFFCQCEACMLDWLGVVRTQVIQKALQKLPYYYQCALVRNVEDGPAMIKDLNHMLKVLAMNADVPCREVSDVVETAKRIYALLANRYQSLNS
ncbi:SET and MYND domain-containing protein 4-like [Fopius arisanus]|uniref:Protein-lysine N-methyltransferase SMYD4 n=1 Tax=Fopius arisanus TaxID=64838 RepID=A0A9R1TV34_9HYME|nr:PREDICTED: SET and MYND domain-containing protein 4-like [Fopius arisanus]